MANGYNIDKFIKRIENTLTGNKYICVFVPGEELRENVMEDEILSHIFFSHPSENIGLMVKNFSFSTITLGTTMLKSRGIEIPVTNSRQQGTLNLDIYNTGAEWIGIKKLGNLYYSQKTGFYGYWSDLLFNIEVTEFLPNGNPHIKHIFSNCTISDYGSINLSYEDAASLETFNITVNFTDYNVTLKE